MTNFEIAADTGRRVYLSASKYYAAGGELQFTANGTREIHITDNLGSVRCVITGTGTEIKSYDYKPYGELEWSSTGTQERKGFATAEYDGESDYYSMGIRMYSAEFGRFLAVDPLFEAMPRHTPYHYGFNSPLVWKDLTGLIPELEGTVDISDGLLALSNKENLRVNDEKYDPNRLILPPQTLTEWVAAGDKYKTGKSKPSSGSTGSGNNGAWKITNKWDEKYIAAYRIFAGKQAQMYRDQGKEFTCEDLPLQILIDFASQNELPLILETKEGVVFDASDSKWNGDIEKFTCEVLGNFASVDLQEESNTIGIGLEDIQAGDLLIQVYPNTNGRGHHTQLVTGIDANISRINIIQGNTVDKSVEQWKLTKSPCSAFGYIGDRLNNGWYGFDGSYFSGRTLTFFRTNMLNQYQYKSWNFLNFNKGK